MVDVPIYTKAEMDAQLDRISALSAELETVKGGLDEARRSNREARAIISATHKRAVTHQNCQRHSCPICEGGLFQCADCGAAEIETEQRVCTGRATESKLAGREVTEARLPVTGPYVDRIIRIFRDRPDDDGSAVVLQDYARAALRGEAS